MTIVATIMEIKMINHFFLYMCVLLVVAYRAATFLSENMMALFMMIVNVGDSYI